MSWLADKIAGLQAQTQQYDVPPTEPKGTFLAARVSGRTQSADARGRGRAVPGRARRVAAEAA